MRIPGALLCAVAAAIGLTACGGGGDSPPPAVVSQQEATAVVQQVNGAATLITDTLYIGPIVVSDLYSQGANASATTVTKTCTGGGSLEATFQKSSPVGYVRVGDTVTIDYAACKVSSSGRLSLTGSAVVTVTNVGSATTAQSFNVVASDLRWAYTTTSGEVWLDTLNGSFSTLLTADAVATFVGSTPLTGSLSGYAPAIGILNGSYSASNVSSSTISAPGTFAHSHALGTTYTGPDSIPHYVAVSTSTPVTFWTTDATVKTAGKFRIVGYNGANIDLSNASYSSSTVSVDSGADGTVDLTFTLDGAYLM